MSESNSGNSSVLLVGGPDAGKSNFLFRLWIAVDAGKGTLKKNGLPDEVTYLNNGAESLMKGRFAARTSGEVIEQATIPIRSTELAGRVGLLVVPDVPGEKILEIYRLRQWSELWEGKIKHGCGCLVFLRAGSSETVPSLDYAACVAALGAPLPAQQKTGVHGPNEIQELPSETPTDIVLTDWLQFLRRAFTDRVGGTYRPRVGLVVSAWDAVPQDAQNQSPEEYLASEFPLVYQFVKANGDAFDFEFFGVSILSGDLDSDESFKVEFRNGNPADFGYVIHSLGGLKQKDTDITIPVAWALGWQSRDQMAKGVD